MSSCTFVDSDSQVTTPTLKYPPFSWNNRTNNAVESYLMTACSHSIYLLVFCLEPGQQQMWLTIVVGWQSARICFSNWQRKWRVTKHHKVNLRKNDLTFLSQICNGLLPILYRMDKNPLWNVFLNIVYNIKVYLRPNYRLTFRPYDYALLLPRLQVVKCSSSVYEIA